MSRVQVEGFAKRYGSHTVVSGVDLVIDEGEFVTLLGPSGCGKTTILRSICGLSEPSDGIVRIGEVVVDDPRRGIHVPPNRRGLGMVFQSYALWPHMTVAGNVAYPLRARRRPRRQIADRVERALELVGLAGYGSRHVADLSGGQQQRVSFARALVDRPGVLLLDEPLSNLDARLRADMRKELRKLHRELGTTTVFVTHDQLEALTLSDRIVVMDHGTVIQQGTPNEVFASPASRFVAGFLGYENFVRGRVRQNGESEAVIYAPALGGDVVATASTPLVAGAAVEVAVRASSLTISPCSGASCRADGHAVIRDITYLGDALECSLQSEEASIVVRVPVMQSSVEIGAAVHVSAAMCEAVAFPVADDEGAPGTLPLPSAPRPHVAGDPTAAGVANIGAGVR